MIQSRLILLKQWLPILLLLVMSGCSRVQNPDHYFMNRYYDFRDMIHLGVGVTAANDHTGVIPPSFGVYAQVTDLLKLGAITHNGPVAELDHRGTGVYMENRVRAGLLWWEAILLNQYYDDPELSFYTNYFKTRDTLWRERMRRPSRYWMGAPPKDYVYDHWNSRIQYNGPLLHNGWQHIYNSQLEVALSEPFITKVGFTARVGFDVSEIGDFLLGWFTLDYYGDDLTPAEYREARGLVSTQPVTAAVPQPQPQPTPVADLSAEELERLRRENEELRRRMEASAPTEVIVRELPAHILFDIGTDRLRPEGRQVLSQLAQDLRAEFAGQQIIVEGHTDSQPIRATRNRWRSNWDLGAARALAVLHYLMNEEKIPDAQFEQARTFSDHQPAVPNTTPENMQANRRTVILVKARAR